MLTRLARWWLTRTTPRPPEPEPVPKGVLRGECCAPGCGLDLVGDDVHLVVVMSTDDELLGIEGQTAMCADYCAEHCPGGCPHGCAKVDA